MKGKFRLEGDAHIPWSGDTAALGEAVMHFLEGASPAVSPSENATFVRRGNVWEIGFGGRTIHLQHMKGLSNLAALLASPGQEVDAWQLASGEPSRRPLSLGADPVLDRAALASYRQRLAEVDAALAVAEADSDPGRLHTLASEREAVLSELRRATGLGGRARRLGGQSERARKAVSGRIRHGITAIRAIYPELADHLERSVAMGSTLRLLARPSRSPGRPNARQRLAFARPFRGGREPHGRSLPCSAPGRDPLQSWAGRVFVSQLHPRDRVFGPRRDLADQPSRRLAQSPVRTDIAPTAPYSPTGGYLARSLSSRNFQGPGKRKGAIPRRKARPRCWSFCLPTGRVPPPGVRTPGAGREWAS